VTATEVTSLLADGEIKVHGRIVNASNHTTLVQVGGGDAVLAVYKPRAGERPLWDFPLGTLHRREVAAFVVSAFLGWDIVPPTLLREGPLGLGSVQLFIDHDPQRHYFVLVEEVAHDEQLARMAVFDLLINNADRKASHVLLDAGAHIWGCDHGLTFHPQAKLRTVIWEFGGVPLHEQWSADLGRLAAALEDRHSAVRGDLASLLSGAEVAMLARRAALLGAADALPDIDEDLRPYPWPPL